MPLPGGGGAAHLAGRGGEDQERRQHRRAGDRGAKDRKEEGRECVRGTRDIGRGERGNERDKERDGEREEDGVRE